MGTTTFIRSDHFKHFISLSPACPAAANGTWELHDVSGPEGIKYDRLELVDLDEDGDLDILTCEERFGGKGLFRMCNLVAPNPAPRRWLTISTASMPVPAQPS